MKEACTHVVTSFNDCINCRDLNGLSNLMTEDHVFIDSANNTTAGKARCVEAWRGFFAAFPDYRNHFEGMQLTGNQVAIVGHSACSDVRLAGPALWTAKLEGDLIAEWRVYEDTTANRRLLGLEK
jgi:ketosteroid isomerase-like protein